MQIHKPAYNMNAQPPDPNEPPPRRLRRLHRVWPDRDGNISYLVTPCVDGRGHVLDNEETFQRLVEFLLDSPQRYGWYGRRFVIMPDHIHVIAHMGAGSMRFFDKLFGKTPKKQPPPDPGRPTLAKLPPIKEESTSAPQRRV